MTSYALALHRVSGACIRASIHSLGALMLGTLVTSKGISYFKMGVENDRLPGSTSYKIWGIALAVLGTALMAGSLVSTGMALATYASKITALGAWGIEPITMISFISLFAIAAASVGFDIVKQTA